MRKARRHGVVFPVTHVDIPHVGQFGQHLEGFLALTGPFQSVCPHHFINGKPCHHAHGVAHRLFRLLDQFTIKTQPILQRTAILIGALIALPGKKMARHCAVVSCVNHHNVETGLAGPKGCLAVPAAVIADILPTHRACLDRMLMPCDRAMFRTNRHFPRVKTAAVLAVVDKFNPCERAVLMHRIHHCGKVRQITVIPHAGFRKRLHVTRWMKVTLFCSDDSPAAFRLHAAHADHAVGEHPPHAVAVGNLIKPVWCRHRTDCYGVKENVVTGVTLHIHRLADSVVRLIIFLRGIGLRKSGALITARSRQTVIKVDPGKLPLHTEVPVRRPDLRLIQRAN